MNDQIKGPLVTVTLGNGVFDAFKKYLYNLYFLEVQKEKKQNRD